jgi:hypothetical protein
MATTWSGSTPIARLASRSSGVAALADDRAGASARRRGSTRVEVALGVERRSCWSASSQTLKVRWMRSLTMQAEVLGRADLLDVEEVPSRCRPRQMAGRTGCRSGPRRFDREVRSSRSRPRSLQDFSQAVLVRCGRSRRVLRPRKSSASQVDDEVVEVFAAEEGVAVGAAHLEDAGVHLEDAHVEGAAAEVKDGDLLALFAAEAVGQRGGGRLVDDAQDLEAGDAPGVFGRLALAVVEVGGDGDDRLINGLAEVSLGDALHLLQDHRADLGR